MEKLEEKEEQDIRILFFHGRTFEYNQNRFTIAGFCTANLIKMGISICSNDDNFVKAEGRKLAVKRLFVNGKESCNGKGVISILAKTEKGQERKLFNRIAASLQLMTKRELISFFDIVKEEE